MVQDFSHQQYGSHVDCSVWLHLPRPADVPVGSSSTAQRLMHLMFADDSQASDVVFVTGSMRYCCTSFAGKPGFKSYLFEFFHYGYTSLSGKQIVFFLEGQPPTTIF